MEYINRPLNDHEMSLLAEKIHNECVAYHEAHGKVGEYLTTVQRRKNRNYQMATRHLREYTSYIEEAMMRLAKFWNSGDERCRSMYQQLRRCLQENQIKDVYGSGFWMNYMYKQHGFQNTFRAMRYFSVLI